jgi:hypothetical protein
MPVEPTLANGERLRPAILHPFDKTSIPLERRRSGLILSVEP